MDRWVKQELYDPRTGEKLDSDAQLAIVLPKRINGFHLGWVAVAQDGLLEIIEYRKVLKTDGMIVLLSLLGTLHYDNDIVIHQSNLSKTIGMRASNFNRALKKLVQLGIILEGPKAGWHKSYRFNPHFAWKGSAKRHKEILRKGKF